MKKPGQPGFFMSAILETLGWRCDLIRPWPSAGLR